MPARKKAETSPAAEAEKAPAPAPGPVPDPASPTESPVESPAAQQVAAAAEAPAAGPPDRYYVVERNGRLRLACSSSPNIFLTMERGLTVGVWARLSYPRGTLFLDGAFGGAPFYDNRRRHYSLDHHAGCVRSFTLSTCEQAAVIVHQGLPLDEGDWLLVLNDLDLDAALAAWVLMNHGELLADEEKLLAKVMPFLRVEGAIDSHGLGAGALTGVAPRERARHEAALAGLAGKAKLAEGLDREGELRTVARLFRELDALLLPEELLGALAAFREAGRASLVNGRVAVLCRSDRGIYEVEEFFRARLGDSLGLLVLDQGGGRYTLRLVDSFMGRDLTKLYRLLNRRDPATRRSAIRGNAWGGSECIGGSPRDGGSRLSGEEILEAARELYGPGGLRGLFRRG